MPSSTATPMLDKVRQYAKDWGIKIVGDPGNWTWTSPEEKPYTHDGPGIFCIDWPSRSVVEPIATTKPRGRVAMEGDVWYLVHEISHVLLNIDPARVDETNSAIIALDYWSGRHLGLMGWDDWMYMFTLGPDLPEPWGSSLQDEEWGAVEPAVHEALLSRSLDYAVSAGLLTVSGEPTFSRAAWMPGSMLAEAIAMPMARAVAAILMEAKR